MDDRSIIIGAAASNNLSVFGGDEASVGASAGGVFDARESTRPAACWPKSACRPVAATWPAPGRAPGRPSAAVGERL